MPPVVTLNGFRYFELPTGYAAAIARNGTTFLHSIYRNGTAVVVGQRITAQRAAEIHEANLFADQKGRGVVDFNGTGAEWERSYFVEET